MNYDLKKAQQIWQTVARVPRGNVASYGQIADLAGLPGRARLVGRVLAFAPDTMKLPWYRIIRSSGHLAFTAGSEQAEIQKKLLQDEAVMVLSNQVKIDQFGWKPSLAELMSMDY